MKMFSSLRFIMAILSSVVLHSNLSVAQDVHPKRASFPSDFIFGAGSSAWQIEGASHEGGRGLGVWDDIVERHKATFVDGDKFSTLIEHYKRYKEDVQHLKHLGVNSYRMTISWSRVMPDGTLKGGINKEGINFYNNLINELLENDIEPFVTIMHFDYPLALHQKLRGFLNRTIVHHYKDYCNILFKTYGDRVKHWTTFNEPQVTAIHNYMRGYDNDNKEPCQDTGICSEAYTFLHNILICHATAAKLYRKKFQATQKGDIGIVLQAPNFVPYSSKVEDVDAANRLMDFSFGWVLDPIYHGDYPQIMRKLVGNRLPKFTRKEKHMIKGSLDFVGVNYYYTLFARHESNRSNMFALDNFDALAATNELNAEGNTIGPKDQYSGMPVYPKGLYDMLIYMKEKYQNPIIYITENGISSPNMTNQLKDENRIAYIATHINATKAAIDNDVNVRGYFVWAAFDTFEFHDGYSGHLGLYHVDFNDNLKRVPKASAEWYRNFLTSNCRQ